MVLYVCLFFDLWLHHCLPNFIFWLPLCVSLISFHPLVKMLIVKFMAHLIQDKLIAGVSSSHSSAVEGTSHSGVIFSVRSIYSFIVSLQPLAYFVYLGFFFLLFYTLTYFVKKFSDEVIVCLIVIFHFLLY